MLRQNIESLREPASSPKVLLTDTTRWASSARLTIALAKAGIDVSAMCRLRGHPLLKTRAVRKVYAYSALHPLKSLRDAIETTGPDVVIPCDDRSVQHLHDLYVHARGEGQPGRALVRLIERSLGSPESYPIVTNRYALLDIAREENISIPETLAVRNVGDLESWATRVPFPWVLKADGMFGGRGVKIAYTVEEAQQCFRELDGIYGLARALKRLTANRDPFWLRSWWTGLRPSVIAQSYVHGHPANCAFICREGKVLAGIAVDVITTSVLTGPASVVRVVDSPEMMVPAERLAKRLGLSGFFGLDFMVDDRSGTTYLIEMNPRCTPVCHLPLGRDRNLVEALRADLSRTPVRELPPMTENDVIALFPQAWVENRKLLDSSFQDVPWEEPALMAELLSPWPERTLLSRAFSAVFDGFEDIGQRFRGPGTRSSQTPVPQWSAAEQKIPNRGNGSEC